MVRETKIVNINGTSVISSSLSNYQTLKTIIVINDFAYINGGAGQVALSSAMGLAEQGYEVIVFSAVEPVMPELLRSGVRVVVTRQQEIVKDTNRLRAAVQGIWNVAAQQTMARVLADLDPAHTIVHVHAWTKALSSSVIRVAIRQGFKVVCTLHDYFSACPNGGFFNYRTQRICGERPLSLNCIATNCDVRNYPQKLWRVARQAVQSKIGLIPDGIKHFIFISEFSKSKLQPFVPKGAHVYRVDNPINVVREDRIDVASNRELVFVGRLSPEKGVVMLAAAANRINLAPIFVGGGECHEQVLAACPKASITGWVSRGKVLEYLRTARALILPSLWYETQGLVVAEAAALGIPSIVPDTCAARDMVENGKTGLWFRGGDEDDLLEKLLVIQRDNAAEKLGNNAYEKYWSNPTTLIKHIKELERCYQNVLG